MPNTKDTSANPASSSGNAALGQLNPETSTPKVKKEKKKNRLQLQEMEKVKTLVHRRGLAKGKVTKVLNILNPEDEEPPVLTEAQIKVHQRKVESAYAEYNELHVKILEQLTEEQQNAQDVNYAEFEELYDQVSLILEEQQQDLLRNNDAIPNQQNVGAYQQPPVVVHQPLRMPVPTFDGQYENWPKFKAMFKDLVDKSPDPPAVKLYHLDKALVGSAAGLIDAKTINDGNYAHAWVILEERYENKRHTIGKHIDSLLSLKRMTKECHTELRNLVDDCTRHVESLKFLNQDFLGVSDLFLVHLLTAALDKDTRRRWESTIKHGELPTYDNMITYLKEECFIMERCETTSHKQPQPKLAHKSSTQKVNAAITSGNEAKCDFCGKNHLNFSCPDFKSLNVQERLAKVRERNVCFNCLKRGHRGKDCPSEKTCNKCKRRHHTLLHAEERAKIVTESKDTTSKQEESQVPERSAEQVQLTSATCSKEEVALQQVLLLTAVVNVMDKNNKPHPCRVLLDSGSQANLITRSTAELLGLQQSPSSITVTGVNNTRSRVSKSTVVEIRSQHSKFHANVQCLVTDAVTSVLPTSNVSVKNWEIPVGVRLADPDFFKPGRIDMLLGNQWFLRLLLPGEYSIADDLPVLRETQLGWVVGGMCSEPLDSSIIMHAHAITLDDLSKSVQRFWEFEGVQEDLEKSSEEEECEAHFKATHWRSSSGRYVVQVPLRDCVDRLDDCRSLALRRFHILERKFDQQTDVKRQYVDFMEEYQALGHCKVIDEAKDADGLLKCYLPHHAVLRPTNTTTKCRVVFDASASTSGYSLNDVQKVGSIPQNDLNSIALRFRIPRYALTADVQKMYRQTLLDESHSPLHRVFWRKDRHGPLKVLELTTVTYGTASAPFLATRALKQLADDERGKYPEAAKIVDNDFYVDNALFGSNDIREAAELQRQLVELLESGGLHLHKWASNESSLLETIPEEDKEELVSIEEDGISDIVKTLGLMWEPKMDYLLLASPPSFDVQTPTKRQVLSVISRMFDPLGIVAPVILIGKLLMKDVWKEDVGWDDVIGGQLEQQWKKFLESVSEVNQIRVPRHVVASNAVHSELHGFADASRDAYGACIYVRSIVPGQPAEVRLLCAKSRLVPKAVTTIPRKELLGALLLHRLVKKVLGAVQLKFENVVLWSDSQVVLAWLKKNPELLEVFVKNRVCEINATGEQFTWKYVNTSENPADIVSRGQSATTLAKSELWWTGPKFLKCEDYANKNPVPIPDEDLPELKCAAVVNAVDRFDELPVFKRFESFRKLQRVLAYVLRFAKNSKQKQKEDRTLKLFPTVAELRDSLKVIVKVQQNRHLAEEIALIQSGESSKKLNPLSPFVDNDGLLRVGGRMGNSKLPFDVKHQLVLPSHNVVVKSLIRAIHHENLHTGPLGVLAALRRQFWITNARSEVRKVTRTCVQCFRMRPHTLEQFMGDLPASRCDKALAFQRVGIDFAGPIMIKQCGRKMAPVKGYICLFICMVTKGIHLEAVENLSTEAFVAALQRFVSRRGIPGIIWTDNGTNFIGAKRELHELYQLFKQQQTARQIFEFCQPRQICWKTIPPNAPHMGGLWEAGVKSAKTILKRVSQSALLTMMEFGTLLCQIEAVLNSRPLYAPSDNPNDPEPLTPGHMMIDRPLTAIPEPTYDGIPVNRLSRWQYVQHLRNGFWKRWSGEYLMELQARSKWRTKKDNVKPGMIVLIKEDNLPAQCWKMGKIETLFPGKDGIVRVVELRTATGVLKRPISKLAPLPILDNSPSSPAEDVRATV